MSSELRAELLNGVIQAAICEHIETIRAYNSRAYDGTPGTDRIVTTGPVSFD